MGEDESRRVADSLNCQIGELPMKYLGIPLDNSKLGMIAFHEMVDKVVKKSFPIGGKEYVLRKSYTI
jgi:hypothetical protein